LIKYFIGQVLTNCKRYESFESKLWLNIKWHIHFNESNVFSKFWTWLTTYFQCSWSSPLKSHDCPCSKKQGYLSLTNCILILDQLQELWELWIKLWLNIKWHILL
jgi:hypothetical protein